MAAFRDNASDFSTVPLVEDSKVGQLLYAFEDKEELKCKSDVQWVGLQFYEHLLLVRYKKRCCSCGPPSYYAEAIPRFRILNVTFTNGRRGLWRWGLFLFVVGLFLFITGFFLDNPGRATLVTLGFIVMVISPILLCLRRRWRYVTIDVKGNGGGKWFSNARTYIIRFRRDNSPDEGFIFNYVFGALSQEFAPFHALSHLHEGSLAHPLNYDNIKSEPWFHPDEEGQVFGVAYGQLPPKLKRFAASKAPPSKMGPTADVVPDMEMTQRPLPHSSSASSTGRGTTEENLRDASEVNLGLPEEQHQQEHGGRNHRNKEKRHHMHHRRHVNDPMAEV